MSPREVSRLSNVLSDLPEAEEERSAVPRSAEDTPQGFLPMLATAGVIAANDLLWWLEEPFPSRHLVAGRAGWR
jgi:hypothetical protein